MSSVSTSRTTWCFWTVLLSPWQDTTCGSTSLTACFSSLNSIFVYTDVQFGDAWSDSIIRMKCGVCFVGSAGYVCVLYTVADLLPRTPQGCHKVQSKALGEEEVEISDKFLEVNAFNSNRFDPKFYAGWEDPGANGKEEPETTWEGMDMVKEQDKDGVVKQLESGKAVGALKNRHLLLGGLLYYVSDPDDDPTPRLYIPKQLQDAVIKQYHADNGHMGIDKTFESIKRKYYFPNLYQRLTS